MVVTPNDCDAGAALCQEVLKYWRRRSLPQMFLALLHRRDNKPQGTGVSELSVEENRFKPKLFGYEAFQLWHPASHFP